MDGRTALIRPHRNDIGRYRRLPPTHLTDIERLYIEARLFEKRAALQHCVHSLDGIGPVGQRARVRTPRVTERGWSRPFDDPIKLDDGRQLVTLRDAGEYIAACPRPSTSGKPQSRSVEYADWLISIKNTRAQ